MGALEQVMQLRGQGMSDEDISGTLQQQGITPKEITDAINQANIKNAVTGEAGQDAPKTAPVATAAETGQYTQPANAGGYAPQTQDYSQQGAPQEYYEEAPYGTGAAAGTSPDTMIELATQVFSEKIRKTSKVVDELTEFKTLAQVKLDNMEERLKRMEKIIDTVQIKILEKVGSFASEMQKTQKELNMVESTVGKMNKSKAKKIAPKKK